MKTKNLAAAIVIAIFVALVAFSLCSCAGVQTPRFSIETQYGRFSYELPELKGLQK